MGKTFPSLGDRLAEPSKSCVLLRQDQNTCLVLTARDEVIPQAEPGCEGTFRPHLLPPHVPASPLGHSHRGQLGKSGTSWLLMGGGAPHRPSPPVQQAPLQDQG